MVTMSLQFRLAVFSVEVICLTIIPKILSPSAILNTSMLQSIAILGRQPALGIAELESLYGAETLRAISDSAAILQMPSDSIQLARFGGTVKLCRVVASLPTTDWREITAHLLEAAPRHAGSLPEGGKLQLGLSVYGLNVHPRQLQASGLELKKAIRSTGRSVRLIPNKEPALNSAQVLHNHLTGPLGWELVFVRDGNQTIFAQTVAVQDIEAYARRDQARPRRDARVGMLPPKLAQIIINLAHPQLSPKLLREHSDEYDRPTAEELRGILDPFCGTGVILQEALLMGHSVIGTDLDQKMIEYTNANLSWLGGKKLIKVSANPTQIIFQADATSYTWPAPIDAVASETYLGRPLSSLPANADLEKIVQDVNTIHKKFLQNLARQTKSGRKLCLAVPAWKTNSGFKHLPVLDSLEVLGYTRMSFVHAKNNDLIYHRENQIVARELVVLQRK